MSRKGNREALSFELTPLIDVVFLLLIFFLVTSVFKKEELALLLNLPKASEGKSQQAQKKNIT
ncbi:MAG: biopolymer transport protein ExbD, partial [Thermoproteota archaeon]